MKTGNMMKDLKILIPEIVADTVTSNNPLHSDRLVKIACTLYSKNKSWAKKITDTDKGRDTLYSYMTHWYEGFKLTNRWIDEKRGA